MLRLGLRNFLRLSVRQNPVRYISGVKYKQEWFIDFCTFHFTGEATEIRIPVPYGHIAGKVMDWLIISEDLLSNPNTGLSLANTPNSRFLLVNTLNSLLCSGLGRSLGEAYSWSARLAGQCWHPWPPGPAAEWGDQVTCHQMPGTDQWPLQGYYLVSVDQPGHGLSSKYPAGMQYKMSDGFVFLR